MADSRASQIATTRGHHMNFSNTRLRAAVAVSTVTTLGCAGMVAATRAGAASTLPTVNVTVTDSGMTFSGGGATTSNGVTTLHAGRYRFHVTTPKGDHALQLFRLHNGYTQEQFGKDAGPAFQNGDVAAVDRIDKGAVFRGGAEATAGHPGDVYVALSEATFYAFDFNGNAHHQLNVTGKAPKQAQIPYSGTLNAYSYGWTVDGTPRAKGWVRFVNRADQPHFVVLQHVKQSTTNAQVKKFFASGANGNPSWGLKESFDSAAVSPTHEQVMRLNLPAGKYLVMCFFPDYFSGMPHAFMGMWRLIQLH
jgi:hypothetical protein